MRNFEKPAFMAPTFFEIDILLSLKMIIILRFSTPISLSASKDKPLLIAPSPITGMILKFSLFKSLATAIPNAAESEVELCPASQTSCTLSLRFWKPDSPLYWRNVEKRSARPVKILCT